MVFIVVGDRIPFTHRTKEAKPPINQAGWSDLQYMFLHWSGKYNDQHINNVTVNKNHFRKEVMNQTKQGLSPV